MARLTKGSVGQVVDNGSIKLRWRWEGKRYSLGTGIHPGDKIGAIRLAEVIRVISRDLQYGEFSGDTSKYKALLKPESVKPVPQVTIPTLQTLWDKYTDFRRPSLSPNTLIKDYVAVSKALERCPYGLEQQGQVRDWLIKNYPPESAKRILTRINACCRWAQQSQLIPSNPFQGMAASISIPKGERGRDEIDPFSPDERAAIIAGFESSQYYRHYAPLVQFLFLTGCRPGEALGLEWSHISDGLIHFQQTSVNGLRGELKQGLKTQSSRKFPVNRQLQELLDNIPRVNKLVFPSPTGRVIDWTNFRARAWVTVLKSVGVRYRKVYQTRHTFITEALRRGMSVQDVAKLVGNSPQVIYAHYAGVSRDLVVPEFS